MHVYSDGGIDISRDGKYVVVCGMLLVPKPVEYIAAAENLRAHFRQSPNSSFRRVPLEHHSEAEANADDSTPVLSAFRTTNNRRRTSIQTVADIDKPATDGSTEQSNLSLLHLSSMARTASRSLFNLGQQSMTFMPRYVNDNPAYHFNGLPIPPSDPDESSLLQPPTAGSLRFQQPSMSTVALEEQAASTSTATTQSSSTSILPTPLTSRSFPIRQSSGFMLKEHICLFELIADKSSSEGEMASGKASPCGTTSIPTSASRNDQDMMDDDYIECHAISNQELSVNLVQCKQLTSSLMKAIVSTKFSPSGRYIVLGYGVRTNAKEVEDHVNKRVACEVVDSLTPGLDSVAFFTHPDDEVNVSVFHPLPGLGLVYGTKTGKLRVFQRAFSELEVVYDEEEGGKDSNLDI